MLGHEWPDEGLIFVISPRTDKITPIIQNMNKLNFKLDIID
jgi:hypothetical protein